MEMSAHLSQTTVDRTGISNPVADLSDSRVSRSDDNQAPTSSQKSPRWLKSYGPGTPDPWIQIKIAIPIVFALTVWSFYVIVGRVCAPMIRERSGSGLGRGVGIGTMIGFVVIWLLFQWSYIKMITTGPGLAPDFLSPSSPPQDSSVSQTSIDADHAGTQPVIGRATSPDPDPAELFPVANLLPLSLSLTTNHDRASSATLANFAPGPVMGKATTAQPDYRDIQRPIPYVETGPRRCAHCKINKPDRAHHCRHCGVCILQFDHHCLWIGQCVGWANHKFFIIFTFWSMIYTGYMVGLLGAYVSKIPGTDGQAIGLLAVSALFCSFTALMFGSHIHLILNGMSTVESYRGRDQSEREAAVLQREYGYLWRNSEKRRVKRHWEDTWGGSQVNARWKWGTAWQMWEQEMGRSHLGWICKPLGNGLHFLPNPRFGPHGEWLKKVDWPNGVQ